MDQHFEIEAQPLEDSDQSYLEEKLREIFEHVTRPGPKPLSGVNGLVRWHFDVPQQVLVVRTRWRGTQISMQVVHQAVYGGDPRTLRLIAESFLRSAPG